MHSAMGPQVFGEGGLRGNATPSSVANTWVCVALGGQAGVSVTRLEKFLELPETEEVSAAPGSVVGSISIQNASFTWAAPAEGKEEGEGTLTNINLEVRPGELIVVIGEVSGERGAEAGAGQGVRGGGRRCRWGRANPLCWLL